MNLNDYQAQAWATAIYPGAGQGDLTYPVLLLVGEVAEFVERCRTVLEHEMPPISDIGAQKELGDILWALAATATEAEATLSIWFNSNLPPDPFPSVPNVSRILSLADRLQLTAGQLSGFAGKEFRDGRRSDRSTILQPLGQTLAALCQELCQQLGWELANIMQQNLKKLQDRQRRGVLQGEGDDR